ncbi:doubled CXXCH motif (paired_CXXCH_1) [mine drainage metagenome]|uniref:Doubled CXXCH motif (Paired_CXXCH_1) n=1 Tax=mine drainage metagenome TaxID=410659 RepID=A0A1J5P8S3_9ZZZZ
MTGVHPIAVPYPYNNAINTYNGIVTGAGVNLSDFVANPHAPTAKAVKLYTDDGSGNVSAGPVSAKSGIECTSCHDPHNKQVQDKLFLRGKLAGSTAASGYLCLQCHIK